MVSKTSSAADPDPAFWYQKDGSSRNLGEQIDTRKKRLLKNKSLIIFILGIDRFPASPITTLFSHIVPAVFRCAATTANNLDKASCPARSSTLRTAKYHLSCTLFFPIARFCLLKLRCGIYPLEPYNSPRRRIPHAAKSVCLSVILG